MQCEFTLADLAIRTNSKLVGDPQYIIRGIADLETATEHDASFLSNPRYEQAMQKSQAGVIFVSPNTPLMGNRNYLLNENPSKAFQATIEIFHGDFQEITGFTGIHPTAVIHPSSQIGANVTICPYAVIDKNVNVGDGTIIGAGCYIGPHTQIGSNCILHPHSIVRERCTIGNRVILQPGAVIGSCGFGYLTDNQGKHTKLNQVGTVFIEDDVEVGANSTIDRARFKATRIGRGTKLDNLVQIAHGVVIGEDNIFAAQTGIAGSTTTGRLVIGGGQVAIAGHLKIGPRVILAGRAGVTKSLMEAGEYSGVPAIPRREHNRQGVFIRKCSEFIKQIQKHQEEIAQIKSHLDQLIN